LPIYFCCLEEKKQTMADQVFVDSVGLGMTSLFTTMGQTTADKFDDVLNAFSTKSLHSNQTKALLADGFKLWCTCAPATLRIDILTKYAKELFQLIDILVLSEPINNNAGSKDSEYKGPVKTAKVLAESLTTAGQMDQTQQLMTLFAPFAFQSLRTLVAKSPKFADKLVMNNVETSTTCLTELLTILLRILPYSGSVILEKEEEAIKEGVVVQAVFPLLVQSQSEALKSAAAASMQTLLQVAKPSVIPHGKALLDTIRKSNNSQLLMAFVSSPELYAASKLAVVTNLDLFLKQPYMMYSSLFMNISNDSPAALVPHLDFLVNQLSLATNVAAITLLTLSNVAAAHANDVFPFLPTILTKGKVPNGDVALSKVLGALSRASKPANAADTMLEHLVVLLESPGSSMATASILMEISNTTELLSHKGVIAPFMQRIAKFKSASEIIFAKIEDYAAG
jgi:hypothetical protein